MLIPLSSKTWVIPSFWPSNPSGMGPPRGGATVCPGRVPGEHHCAAQLRLMGKCNDREAEEERPEKGTVPRAACLPVSSLRKDTGRQAARGTVPWPVASLRKDTG